MVNKLNIFYLISTIMSQGQDERDIQGLLQQKKMFSNIIEYDKRNCTDCCCIIIGLLFTIAIFTIAAVGVNHQNENKVSLPSDSTGKVCGIDYKTYSFVYFTNPPDITSRVCVSACPKAGAAKLECVTAGNIGCKFNNVAGFTVSYYDNEPVNDSNGNFCMPTSPTLRKQIQENANLDSRLVFFNSYHVLLLCLLFAIGISIFFVVINSFCARSMVWVTLIGSMIVLLGLAVILFLYKTQSRSKIYLGIALAVLLLVIVISICLYRKQVPITGVFLDEATKFTGKNPSNILFVLIFMIFTAGFLFMFIFEYKGLVSMGQPTFKKESLYYDANRRGSWATWTVLSIQLVWGIFFLKEAFNFCISAQAVLYYLTKGGGGLCTIGDVLQLLLFKHLGSVIAASFMDIFFIPDIFLDLFRTDSSESSSGGCFKFFDLVRSDAMAYVALTGNPFCHASKYCEYFTHSSMLHSSDQSAMRLYRICAHILIAGAVSIVGLYIKGNIEPYTVGMTIIIGMFVATFIISYQSDPAEALLLMYCIDEEYYRRSPKKLANSPADKQQQQKYLEWLERVYAKKNNITSGFANQLKEIKVENWKEEQSS